jgi:hypothetical protein
MTFHFTMNDFQGMRNQSRGEGGAQSGRMSSSDHSVVKAEVVPFDDDEDTELLSSFASMMMSSLNTLSEPSLVSSGSSMHARKMEEVRLHPLQRNEHDCLGYLQLQAIVPSFQALPTELALLSQKTILCIETKSVTHSDFPTDRHSAIFSHPLLVEAMETLFIPIAIVPPHPSSTGLSCRVSKISFIDASGHDVLSPISSDQLTFSLLLESMLLVLHMNQHLVPTFLQNLVDDSMATNRKPAVISERSVCFGFPDNMPSEHELRGMDGIRSVRLGRFRSGGDHGPVVECKYDSKVTSFSALVNHMLSKLNPPPKQIIVYCHSNDERMAARVEIVKLSDRFHQEMEQRQVAIVHVGGNPAMIFEPQIDWTVLRQTHLRFVPMTPQQAEQVQTLFADRQYDRATNLFSPRQTQFLVAAIHGDNNHTFHDVLGYPILEAWISNVEKRPPQRVPEEDAGPGFVDVEPEVYFIWR